VRRQERLGALRRQRGDRVDEALDDAGVRGRRRDDRIVAERPRVADPKPVGLLARRAEAEAARAATAHEEDVRLRAVDLDQLGERADVEQRHWGRGGGPRLRTRSQRHDAERRLLAHAARHQVEVARLEDLELEQAIRKQHRAQRKERQVGHGRLTA